VMGRWQVWLSKVFLSQRVRTNSTVCFILMNVSDAATCINPHILLPVQDTGKLEELLIFWINFSVTAAKVPHLHILQKSYSFRQYRKILSIFTD